MRTNVTLSSKWDDARILAAFGLSNVAKDHDNVDGVDGTQVIYHVGKTEIIIVRSAVTGLAVTVGGRGPFAGIWHMDNCD